MTVPVQQSQPSPQFARRIHRAMVTGLILFVIVCQFLLVTSPMGEWGLAPLAPLLLGVSLASCIAGILVSYRMPRVSNGESMQEYWLKAAPKAIIPWALLEGAALLAIVVYWRTGSRAAIAVAVVVIVIFALLNPRYFETRS